jgi:N-acetylglutamate synthase-like GNAT family acetyltransferase
VNEMMQTFSHQEVESESVFIRKARPEDAQLIHEVLKQAFLNIDEPNYSARAINAAIVETWRIRERIISHQPVLVAEYHEQIIGTISGHKAHMSMKVESFAVHPQFQRRGIGMQLLEKLEALAQSYHCHKIYLFTAWSMMDAARLYITLGYEKEGYLRKQFYGEDLVIFGKCLVNAGELQWSTSEQTLQTRHSITRYWLF